MWLLFVVVMAATGSCNSKSEGDEIAVTSATVAIKEFKLKANSLLLTSLDSVFFSLDLDNGVIFNADSLPKGTDVSRLVVDITFMNTMTAANLNFRKDNVKDTTVNYLTNPGDSIDFTYPVTLNVTAADGTSTYEYLLKVNVHKVEPDSLIWDRLATSALPSSKSDPKTQKTIATTGGVYTLIEESDGSFSMARAEDMASLPDATAESFNPGFVPEIESFCEAAGNFYMLSSDGTLYESQNAEDWDATSEKWISIIGTYADHILGLKENDGEMYYCHYPEDNVIADGMSAEDFPIAGRSELGIIETGWSPLPIGIFNGGTDRNGNISGATWAFDGKSWTIISEKPAPALTGSTLIRYVTFRNSGSLRKKTELDVWLLMGGKDSEDNYNTDLYLTLDNGVTWTKASAFMQLPQAFPRLEGADAIVEYSELSASLAANWSRRDIKDPGRWMKISYNIDGNDIYWECPYIYIIGGTTPEGTLSDILWRMVLARLEFTPIF